MLERVVGERLKPMCATQKIESKSLVLAHHTDDLMSLDLTSPVWAKCQPVHITHYWSGEVAPETRHAEARLCWNNEFLMVRFVGNQHEPLNVSPTPSLSSKTLGLWDRDVCEIFVAPDVSNPNRYFEFEAAPSGEWIDLELRITPQGRETEWEYASGMKTAASIRKSQIVIGIAVPWSARLPKPASGTEWLINLFRCVGFDEPTRYMAWIPTRTPEPNFHVPDAFGRLLFVMN